jgi:hypothetical protein
MQNSPIGLKDSHYESRFIPSRSYSNLDNIMETVIQPDLQETQLMYPALLQK